MKKAQLSTMTVAELKALAKKKSVSLPAGAKKAEIVEMLANNANGTAKTAAKKSSLPLKSAPIKAVPKKEKEKVSAAAKQPQEETVISRRPSQKEAKKISPVREWKTPPRAEEPHMAQERVAGAKYYTGPLRQPAAASFEELPQGYGEDKITFLSRDPFIAYAYWEISPARIESEKQWFGVDAKLCVRIYDITGVLQFDGRNALGYYDQDVTEKIGSWYFDLGRPSHAFCAEIGLRAPEGRFLSMARSGCITMPRDTVSDVVDQEWMMLEEDVMKLYGIPSGLSSPEVNEMLKRRRRLEKQHLEITSPGLFSRAAKKVSG